MDNVFVTDYESIHGFDLHVAFVDDKLRDEFAERTHITARKLQVINELSEKFLWCVIFSGKEVEIKFAGLEDDGKRNLTIWSPSRATVFVAAASYDEVENVARKTIIDFVESHDNLKTNVQYNATDGSVIREDGGYDEYTTPLIGPIREAFLHYMKKDNISVFDTLFKFVLESKLNRYDSVVLNFHASKEPDDHSWFFGEEPDFDSITEEVCHNGMCIFDVRKKDAEKILDEMGLKYTDIKNERSAIDCWMCDYSLQIEKKK